MHSHNARQLKEEHLPYLDTWWSWQGQRSIETEGVESETPLCYIHIPAQLADIEDEADGAR